MYEQQLPCTVIQVIERIITYSRCTLIIQNVYETVNKHNGGAVLLHHSLVYVESYDGE